MSTVVEKRLKEFCSNMEYLFFYTDKYFFWQELLLKAKSEKKKIKYEKEIDDKIIKIKQFFIECSYLFLTIEIIEKYLKDEEKLRVIKKVYEENKEEIEEEVRKYKEKQAEKPYWATEEKAIQELKDLNQSLFLDQYLNVRKVFFNFIKGKSKKEKKSEATENVYFIRDYIISDEYLNAKKVVEEEICKCIITYINRNEKINEKKVIEYMERNFYDIFDGYKYAEEMRTNAFVYYPDLRI